MQQDVSTAMAAQRKASKLNQLMKRKSFTKAALETSLKQILTRKMHNNVTCTISRMGPGKPYVNPKPSIAKDSYPFVTWVTASEQPRSMSVIVAKTSSPWLLGD